MSFFPNILLTTDAHQYGILAQNLLNGNGYTLAGNPELIFPPGYSLLLMIPLLFLNPNNAVLFLMYLGFLSLITGIFFLTKKYSNTKIAFVTALFTALNGNLILYTLLGYAEVLMFGLLFYSFYFFDTKNKRKLFASGLLFGIAYLIKPEALFYISIFLILKFITHRFSISKTLLYFAIPAAICIFGYSTYLYQQTGKIALTGKVATLEWDRYIENPSIMRDSLQYRINSDGSLGPSLKEYNLSEVNFYKRGSINLSSLKKGIFEILLPFKYIAVALLLSFIFLKKYRKTILFVVLLNIPIDLTLLFHIENRYLMPLLLTTILILSLSASQIFMRKEKNNLLRNGISLISIVCLILLTYYSYYPLRSDYPGLIRQQKETQEWLINNPINGKVILARKPVYSFLASKDYAPFPYAIDAKSLKAYIDKFNDSETTIILDRWSYYAMPQVHKLIREDYESGKKEIVKDKQVLLFENWDK